jgi:hypothetical protein
MRRDLVLTKLLAETKPSAGIGNAVLPSRITSTGCRLYVKLDSFQIGDESELDQSTQPFDK